MGWPRYVLGMAGLLATLAVAIQLEGDLWFTWSPSAHLAIIGGTAALLVATYPIRQLLGGFQDAVRRLEDTTAEERALSLVVLSAAMRYPCALGAISCLFGFIAMLRNLRDPAQVGPAMAYSFVGALFAVFLSELLVAPLWFRVQAAQGGAPASQAQAKPPLPIAPIAAVLLTSVTMLASLFSLAALDLSRK